jgi:hypothetical protein
VWSGACSPHSSGEEVRQRAEGDLDLPQGLMADFAQVIQTRDFPRADVLSARQVQRIFDMEYMIHDPVVILLLRCTTRNRCLSLARAALFLRRQELIRCPDADPAVLCAERLRSVGVQVTVLDSYSRNLVPGRQTAVYVRCMADVPVWGVGVSRDVLGASLRAVLSAAGRSRRTSAIDGTGT